MQDETTKKIEEMNAKLDEVVKSVRKMKNYFKWTLVVTVAVVVLPLIGLVFVIPSFLAQINTITSI